MPTIAAPPLPRRFRDKGDDCQQCLWLPCTFVPPTLRPDASMLLVGEGPGYWEAQEGAFFVGESGIKLDEMLRAVGIDRGSVSLSNALKCYDEAKAASETLQRCAGAFLQHEIRYLAQRGLKVIVAMGDPALRATTGLTGITKHRGKVLPYPDHPDLVVLPTLNPAFVLHKPGIQPIVVSDLALARDARDGRVTPVEVSHETLITVDDVRAFFARIRHVPDVVVDLETTGLDWEAESIRCIGINYGEANHENAVIPVDFFRREGSEARLKVVVRRWLESHRHRFIGQNRKFDTHFLRQWCGVDDRRMDWDDTLIMAYLLNEDTTKGLKSLEALASIYCGFEANYKEKFLGAGLKVKVRKQADFWKVVADEVLWRYCAADCWVTRRVREALWERLRLQPALWRLYRQHYLPLQRAIIEAERVGFYIDRRRAEQVDARLRARATRLEHRHPEDRRVAPPRGTRSGIATNPVAVAVVTEVTTICQILCCS